MANLPTKSITLKDVDVLRSPFRNFNGGPTKFNALGGPRFFNIRLTEEKALELRKAGWRIKELPAREAGEESMWILKVNINFQGQRPPRLVTITAAGKTQITEEIIDTLDAADIASADLILNPYVREDAADASAYLVTGYFKVDLDELELMYEVDEEDAVICDADGVCRVRGVVVNEGEY